MNDKQESEAKQVDDNNDEEKKEENENELESKPNPELEKYIKIGEQCKADLDELYTKISTFKLSSNNAMEFDCQGNKFKINTLVSYSNNLQKNKSDPTIWYTQTVFPGSPQCVYQTWTFSENRLKWDSFISSSKRILIDDKNENVFIINSETKAAAGGMISPRDFVDLLNIYKLDDEDKNYEALQIASKSIKYEPIAEKKGFVRGECVLSGVLFEKLRDDEIEELGLPELKDGDGNVVVWTRVRYLLQSNIKGWIPSSVINTAMSSTNIGMMKDLRNYLINTTFKLK